MIIEGILLARIKSLIITLFKAVRLDLCPFLEPALNKVLSNDLIRARRMPSIIIFNDAKSCYDRVVHCVAALALRRLGASKESTLEMMKTLQHSSHAICTAYAVSETRYGGRQSFPPLQGSGQGNGSVPVIWVAVSAVLITILRNTGMGLSLLS